MEFQEEDKIAYRIKTKQEFMLEFGPDWKTMIHFTWVPEMDQLFGIILPDSVSKKIIAHGYEHWRFLSGSICALSRDMITPVDDNRVSFRSYRYLGKFGPSPLEHVYHEYQKMKILELLKMRGESDDISTLDDSLSARLFVPEGPFIKLNQNN